MDSIEEAEKKHFELLENERQLFKKKEHANKEIIQEFSRRLKENEKRLAVESRASADYKKKHEQIRKKMEKANKEKNESVS